MFGYSTSKSDLKQDKKCSFHSRVKEVFFPGMVVFTCQHCGNSVKKNAVEKHYSFQCSKSRSPVLTCIDCLADFRGDEYIKHTTCLTEAERYGGANYAPNSAQLKQNVWLEACEALLERNDLSTHQKSILSTIIPLRNIPRNKKKFYNFIWNSTKETRTGLIEGLFDMIAAEFTKLQEQKNEKSEEKKTDPNGKKAEDESGKRKRSDSDSAEQTSEVLKKTKKKKDKVKEESDQDPEELHTDDNGGEWEVKVGKKKKKKYLEGTVELEGKGKLQTNESEQERRVLVNHEESNGCIGINEFNGHLEKKQKKKSKHETVSGIEKNVIVAIEEVFKPGKKKTKKHVDKESTRDTSGVNLEVEPRDSNGDLDLGTNHLGEGTERITSIESQNTRSEDDLSKLSKKERKKVLKQRKYEAELRSVESYVKEEESEGKDKAIPEEESIKGKTKKKKKTQKNEITAAAETTELVDTSKNEPEETVTSNGVEEVAALEEGSGGKFNWEGVIIALLSGASGQEMSLKRLSKKVITEYQFRCGEPTTQDTTDKVMAKFNRKIKKTVGVRVLKDRAKLIPV